jgi:hypothetical protein
MVRKLRNLANIRVRIEDPFRLPSDKVYENSNIEGWEAEILIHPSVPPDHQNHKETHQEPKHFKSPHLLLAKRVQDS